MCYRKSKTEAEKAKAQYTVIELPRIALDVDDLNDVVELLKRKEAQALSESPNWLRIKLRDEGNLV